ncbi:hypothetical protein ACFLQO_01430, partial [Candidatus Aenigmatarchaeota archaeon]
MVRRLKDILSKEQYKQAKYIIDLLTKNYKKPEVLKKYPPEKVITEFVNHARDYFGSHGLPWDLEIRASIRQEGVPQGFAHAKADRTNKV